MEWIATETSGADFGDKRLTKRLSLLLNRLDTKPSASLPATCKGWSETQAAYRFFSHDKVSKDSILASHIESTLKRVQAHPTVLCIEDTTFINHEGQRSTPGLGPHTSSLEYGYFLHPMLAVTPDRLCLGSLRAHTWVRDGKFGKRYERAHRPIEEKESQRWIDGYRTACGYQQQSTETQFVYMADRESDIYELFSEGLTGKANWLIRAVRNRKTVESNKLLDQLTKQTSLGKTTFQLSGTKKRKKRTVCQSIYVAKLFLKGVRRPKRGCLPDVEVTAILAREENPPAGEKPVEWLLLTNIDVNSLEEAKEKILWYTCRWEIELFFNVLKSGCQIEKLQLETRERIEFALAVYMIVAWRILYIKQLSRLIPEASCDIVFDAIEWKAIFLITNKDVSPEKPPPLGETTRLLATLGGYLNRKNDSPPGKKALWIGLQRVRDFVMVLNALQEKQVK